MEQLNVKGLKLSCECCLCLNSFTDPRVLPCSHRFCLKCLSNVGWMKPEIKMPCPVCKCEFTVPSNGLSALPEIAITKKPNFGMKKLLKIEEILCNQCSKVGGNDSYCIQCEWSFCLPCGDEHSAETKHLVARLKEGDKKLEPFRCLEHMEEEPEKYCMVCQKLCCKKCIEDSHSSHNCPNIEEVASGVCLCLEKEIDTCRTWKNSSLRRRKCFTGKR